jgi:riboflavin synthase
MFTGIIEAIGAVIAVESHGEDMRLRVDGGRLNVADVSIGESISVSGVCLTVVERIGPALSFDVSRESLSRTTLSRIQSGTRVNLEKALLPTTRLGGHFVSGHVDALGTIESRAMAGRSIQLTIEAPVALFRYIAMKGSICVDGVSLTVNAVECPKFEITVIPHTLAETTLNDAVVGSAVNLEVDILARYLDSLLSGEGVASRGRPITTAFLKEHGFID